MTSPTLVRRARSLGVATALVLVAAGCGSDSTTTAGVEVSGAWARTSPMSADNGAAYMVLSAEDAVSIVSASVPDDIAARVELHETVPVEGAMSDDEMSDDEMSDDEMSDDEMAEGEHDMDDDAHGDMAMTMQPVTSIDIPAGGEAVLAPGGLHVMMLELADPLEVGDTFELTLVTDAGDEIPITVEVRDDAP